jgi:hypothetical protein
MDGCQINSGAFPPSDTEAVIQYQGIKRLLSDPKTVNRARAPQ